MPDYMEIIIGDEDETCDPALAMQVGGRLGIAVSIFPNEGHMLGPELVNVALHRFKAIVLPCDRRASATRSAADVASQMVYYHSNRARN